MKLKRWRWWGMMAVCLALPVHADYKAAMDALKKGDYSTALPLMKASAEARDRDAMLGMGLIYWNGMGVERDKATALGWVRKSATAGNATAMSFLAKVTLEGDGVHQDLNAGREWAKKAAAAGDNPGRILYFMSVVNGPELNVMVDGKQNKALYDRLAQRPVAQRSLDIEAYDTLASAVQDGDAPAKQAAAQALIDMVGPGNMKKALGLLQGLSDLPASLQSAQNVMGGITSIGDTNASLPVFIDARYKSMAVARYMGEKQGVIKSGVCAPDAISLSKLAVTRPLAHETYLPLTQPFFQKTYLIAGDWQETWTFNACGKPIPVRLEFTADGLGRARVAASGS